MNNLLRVTNSAIRCVFESARLVPENRIVSVFASHHNSSQENLKFSSSLTTQKTKMKKLLASMPSIRNTSHVEVWFASFHSVFKPVSFPGFFLQWKRKTWDWHNSSVSGFWFITISSICSVFSRNTSGWCSRRLISVDKACFFFLGWLVRKLLRTLPVLLTLSIGFLQAPQETSIWLWNPPKWR